MKVLHTGQVGYDYWIIFFAGHNQQYSYSWTWETKTFWRSIDQDIAIETAKNAGCVEANEHDLKELIQAIFKAKKFIPSSIR